jgi:phosphomannomutase
MSSDVFSAECIKPKNSEIEQLWSRDAVLLMFKLLKLMSVEQKSVKALSEELPEFYVAKKVMQIDVSPSVISKTLLQNDFKTDENGSVSMKNKKGFVRVKSDESGKKLRIITEAVNAELAEELCGETQKLISIDIDL